MRLLTFSTFVCAVVLCAGRADGGQGTPAVDPEKAPLIRQILDVSHAADLAISAIEITVPAQRAANPQIPPVFLDRFLVQARERRGELVESIVPIYSRTFTLGELNALLQFYQSPLGQRLLEVQPTLARESAQAGQVWGQKIGMDVGRQLAAEGVKFGP